MFARQVGAEMTIGFKLQSLPFTEPLIDAAPDTTGVFALWQNGGVIYLGKASAGGATIRSALSAQFAARKWNGTPQEMRGTRCSWEIADDADGRHRELLHEFETAHHCLPLWNDPQRLPT
jgi:hypothetical protein